MPLRCVWRKSADEEPADTISAVGARAGISGPGSGAQAPPSNAAARLGGTSWRHVSKAEVPAEVIGSSEVNEDHLKFSQIASTMMARLEGMDTEKAFRQALEQANTWKIGGQQLEFFDAAGNLIARFEARPAK